MSLLAKKRGDDIRPYRPEQMQEIWDLIVTELARLGHTLDKAGRPEDLSRPQDFYDGAKSQLFVLERGGAVLGSVAIQKFDPRGGYRGPRFPEHAEDGATAELRRMYVRADHAGKGYGRRLLEQVVSFALGVGYRRINLFTHKDMRAAQALYEQNGFAPVPGGISGHAPEERMYTRELPAF